MNNTSSSPNSEIAYTPNVNVKNYVKKIDSNGNAALIKNKSSSTTGSTRGDKRNNNISELDEKIEEVVKDGIEAFRKDMGKVNIIIAGRTGVGKSTLINSIFHGNFAKTGLGEPITQKINEISKEGIPVTIIDTKGLELKDYQKIKNELQTYILKKNNNKDPHMHIHIAWVCIEEIRYRYEEAELDLIKMLINNKIPVIIVITKSESLKGEKFKSYSMDGEKFKEKIQEEIENIIQKEKFELIQEKIFVIRVMAEKKVLDDGHIIEPKNLDVLIQKTNELIPIGIQNAFRAVLFSLNINKAYDIIEIHKIKAEKYKNKLDVIKYGTQMIIQILEIFCLDLDAPSIREIVKEILFYNDHSSTDYIKLIELFGQTCVNSIKEAFKCKNREKPTKDDILLSIYKLKENFNEYN